MLRWVPAVARTTGFGSGAHEHQHRLRDLLPDLVDNTVRRAAVRNEPAGGGRTYARCGSGRAAFERDVAQARMDHADGDDHLRRAVRAVRERAGTGAVRLADDAVRPAGAVLRRAALTDSGQKKSRAPGPARLISVLTRFFLTRDRGGSG